MSDCLRRSRSSIGSAFRTPSSRLLAIVVGGVAGIACFIGLTLLIHRRLFDPRIRRTSSFGDIAILLILYVQLILGLSTIFVSLNHLDGHEMVRFMNWAQGTLTLQPDAWRLIEGANSIFKLHIFLGMTIFLVFPFTRLVHIWSAPVWYLGRRGYQIVRARPKPVRCEHSGGMVGGPAVVNILPQREKAAAAPRIVSVNGTVIPSSAIIREVQYHPAASPTESWQRAAEALVLRALLLEEADREGIAAEALTDDRGRRETQEEAAIRALIEQAVRIPTPTADELRRYYDGQCRQVPCAGAVRGAPYPHLRAGRQPHGVRGRADEGGGVGGGARCGAA